MIIKLVCQLTINSPSAKHKNILLHEMIHFYIAFKNIKDKSAHGPVFKRLMNQFNQEFGWELTVSVNTKDYKTNETASSAKAKKIKERLF